MTRITFYSSAFVFLILGADAQGMDHALGQVIFRADTAVTKIKNFPIQNLLPELLQRFFAMSNKAAMVLVCKGWFALANFKENWPLFCDLYADVLSLTAHGYQKIYYLMLKKNDVQGMKKLIVTDPDKYGNFAALADCFQKHPGTMAQSDAMREILEKHQVCTISTVKLEADLSDRNDELELNDILVRNDKQALDTFITANKDIAESEYAVVTFGTLEAIEKLSDANIGFGCLARAMCQCGQWSRLDVAELLWDKAEQDINKLYCNVYAIQFALNKKDYGFVEWLCRKGYELNNNFECILKIEYGQRTCMTPLMYAVYQQDPSMVDLLIKCGSSPFEVDGSSRWLGDVLDLANRLGNRKIIDAILLARVVQWKIMNWGAMSWSQSTLCRAEQNSTEQIKKGE